MRAIKLTYDENITVFVLFVISFHLSILVFILTINEIIKIHQRFHYLIILIKYFSFYRVKRKRSTNGNTLFTNRLWAKVSNSLNKNEL